MAREDVVNIFKKNLLYYMERAGMSQADIARYMDVSTSTVAGWCTGKIIPRMDKVKRLADRFGISLPDLLSEDSEIRKKAVRVPVVGRVAAGLPLLAEQEIIDYEDVSPEMAEGGRIFGLRVKGDSMEPRICEGDVLIVREQPDADSGDVVVALIDGEDAVVKRLMKYSDGIALISNNPRYKDMVFSADDIERKPVQIIGKVMENRQKY